MSDIAMRQLILAKSIDAVSLDLGHAALYPYVIQPRISAGTTEVEIPLRWIWDISLSLPKKWENIRLAKIKRVSGLNSETEGITGSLRFIFTANIENSSTEVAVFSADYNIESYLSYQPLRVNIVSPTEEANAIDVTEAETVAGFIMFRTLDVTDQTVIDFFTLLAPPTDTTDSNGDGYYDNPAVYEIADSSAGGVGVTEDFATTAVSHGTGLLVDGTINPIPNLDTDIQSWINAFNYPFDALANRMSADSIEIPLGLFREFDITAPAGDNPTGDTSGTYFPVWINRIERLDPSSDQLRVYFATYNTTDTAVGGNPSTTPVEFAILDLRRSYTSGEIVAITPINNLLLKDPSDITFQQHIGRGHVVLSNLWNKTTSDVDDFFDRFLILITEPADTTYSQAATRLSSFGVSRVPKYVPTMGQSRGLVGTTSTRTVPINPGPNNRFVTEQDEGLGNQIDLEAQIGIIPSVPIERYGYTGGRVQRCVKLVVDATKVGDDPNFYDAYVLPRLVILLGRNPVFGDQWYNGTRFMTFNGDTWQG